LVGEGLAIRPHSETLLAPVAGRVAVLMEDSRHAVGLVLPDGVEILLHVGLDTVDMQGDGFAYLVKVGDEVQAGTPLLKFDREKIKGAGHDDVTVCIITNKNGVDCFDFQTGMQGKAGETVIAAY
jgi:PTS system trehalose-specific IIC component